MIQTRTKSEHFLKCIFLAEKICQKVLKMTIFWCILHVDPSVILKISSVGYQIAAYDVQDLRKAKLRKSAISRKIIFVTKTLILTRI